MSITVASITNYKYIAGTDVGCTGKICSVFWRLVSETVISKIRTIGGT